MLLLQLAQHGRLRAGGGGTTLPRNISEVLGKLCSENSICLLGELGTSKRE